MGEPVAVALGRPSALNDQQFVDGVGVECPEHVAGLVDIKSGSEGATVGEELGEAAHARQPFAFRLPGCLAKLRVRGSRLGEDAQQRAHPGVDARLGGGTALELPAWVGLGDDRLDRRPPIGRNLGACRPAGDRRLHDRLEQGRLAAEGAVDPLHDDTGRPGDAGEVAPV
jgi:hypothetical protein